MKKFTFSLQPLLAYKRTLENQQKGALAEAQGALRRLQALHRAVLEQIERTGAELEHRLDGGSRADDLRAYSFYLHHLGERRLALEAQIREAVQAVRACQEAVVLTMKELKALERLRQEQYQRYLEELRAEEAKEIGDLVSFRTIAGQSD